MFAAGLRGCGQRKKALFIKAVVQQNHIRYGRMTGSDGSRFIQHDGVDGVQVFQALGGFDEDAVFGRLSGAHHDGHGCGKPQRTGAGDDEHGDGAGKGEFKACSGNEPDDGGQNGDDDDCRNEHAADPIRKPGDGRFGIARFIHQTDDLRQGGVVAHAGGTEAEGAILIDGGGDDRIALSLFYGDAFPGDGGLVQIAVSLRDHPIHGNAHAGTDNHDVSRHDLFSGNGDFFTVPDDDCGFGSQVHQLAQRVGGFGFGAGFQIFSHRHQRQNHGGGFKIELMGIVMYQFHVIVAKPRSQTIHGENSINKGSGRTDGHQGVHVRGPHDERLKTGLEKVPVNEKHRNGQKQLGERRNQRIFRSHKNAGNGKPHHMSHGDVHEGNQNDDGRNQSGFHRFLVLQGTILPVLPFFAEAAFSLCGSLCVGPFHRGGAVADFADGLDDVAFRDRRFIIGNGHVVGKEAYVDLGHARQLTDTARDVCLACRAGHAGDVIFFCFHNDLLYSSGLIPSVDRSFQRAELFQRTDYFSLRISSKASSTICVLPFCTSSTTQVSMCSFRIM